MSRSAPTRACSGSACKQLASKSPCKQAASYLEHDFALVSSQHARMHKPELCAIPGLWSNREEFCPSL